MSPCTRRFRKLTPGHFTRCRRRLMWRRRRPPFGREKRWRERSVALECVYPLRGFSVIAISQTADDGRSHELIAGDHPALGDRRREQKYSARRPDGKSPRAVVGRLHIHRAPGLQHGAAFRLLPRRAAAPPAAHDQIRLLLFSSPASSSDVPFRASISTSRDTWTWS